MARGGVAGGQGPVEAPEARGLPGQVQPRDLGRGVEPVLVHLGVEVLGGPLQPVAGTLM